MIIPKFIRQYFDRNIPSSYFIFGKKIQLQNKNVYWTSYKKLEIHIFIIYNMLYKYNT